MLLYFLPMNSLPSPRSFAACYAFQRPLQHANVKRFGYMRVHACVQAVLHILGKSICCHGDDENPRVSDRRDRARR